MPEGLFANQYRQHLLRDRQCRAELVTGIQWKFDVDGDNDIDAQRLHDVDGQVADDATVDQQSITDLHRCEHSRHRHAGANRARKIATLHDEGFAMLDVRRDGAKRNRQFVEVIHMRHVHCELAQHQIELLSLHDALRQHQVGTAHAELEIDRKFRIILLATKAQEFALGLVGKRGRPIQRFDQFLKLRGAHAARIEAANDRSHTRAGDDVDRYALALELHEHADVRRTTRTATAEHQPDAWALALICRTFGHCRCIAKDIDQHYQQNAQISSGVDRICHRETLYGTDSLRMAIIMIVVA